MSPVFEYDVFLSFASADEEFVKPVWQELCLSGLRVFWSDAALKKELGRSWIELIEASLDKSRHMILVCSPASMNSDWVRREYNAFLSQCYKPGVRRLVPILARGYKAEQLPLFLRELQARQLEDPDSLKEVISVLGGVNIEKLKDENQQLRHELDLLRLANLSLAHEVNGLKARLSEIERIKDVDELEDTREADPLASPPSDPPHAAADDPQAETLAAFEFLGLPYDASSGEIRERYKSLRNEYVALLDNCPKGLMEVCKARLRSLEEAFKRVFSERRSEEIQKLQSAYEILQLPEGTILTETVRERYEELKAVCLKAMQSSDPFVKEVATEELAKLEDAYRTWEKA